MQKVVTHNGSKFVVELKAQDHWSSRIIKVWRFDADKRNNKGQFLVDLGVKKDAKVEDVQDGLKVAVAEFLGKTTEATAPSVTALPVSEAGTINQAAQAAKLVELANAGQLDKAKAIAKAAGLPHDARGRGNKGLVSLWLEMATTPDAPQAVTQAAAATPTQANPLGNLDGDALQALVAQALANMLTK